MLVLRHTYISRLRYSVTNLSVESVYDLCRSANNGGRSEDDDHAIELQAL